MVPSTHGRRALLLLLLLVAAARTSSAVEYTITDLGTLGEDPNRSSFAWDINDAGQVVGVSGHTLFLWDAQHGMQDLGISVSGFVHINNAGQISGTADTPRDLGAFLWNSATDVRQLLSPTGWVGRAYGLNDLGIVVGEGSVPGFDAEQACYWDADGDPHVLADPNTSGSHAEDVNNAGQIVGWTGSEGASWRARRAFLWDETNGMQDMGTLDDGGSFARAINNAGVAVGVVAFDYPSTCAFIWDADNGMRPLESPAGVLASAWDINDAGQVVTGSALWDNGVVVNLFEDVGLPAGWTLRAALAINNSGQIVGQGRNPDGQERAFLLTPIPEPATVVLLLSGLLGLAALARWRARRPR